MPRRKLLVGGAAVVIQLIASTRFARAVIGTPSGIVTGSATGGNSVSANSSANVTAGTLVVVLATQNNKSSDVSSVSDTVNTYTKAVSVPTTATLMAGAAIWYVSNAEAVTSGTTWTITWSASITVAGGEYDVDVYTVTGVVGGLDKIGSASSTSAFSITATTGTLSESSEIAIGCGAYSSANTYHQAPGFTNLVNGSTAGGAQFAEDYDIVSTNAPVSYNPSWPSSNFSIAAVVATFAATKIPSKGFPFIPSPLNTF